MPLFYQIESVIVMHEKLLLFTLPLFTMCFQEHFHAFKLKRIKQDFVVFCLDRPFDLHMSYGGNDTDFYVVPFCFICEQYRQNEIVAFVCFFFV